MHSVRLEPTKLILDYCFLCGSISSFRCVFFDPKNENHLLNLQSEYAKSDSNFSDLNMRWPKLPDFGQIHIWHGL